MKKSAVAHRLHIILEPAQYNKLAAKAAETGAPMSELVRRMIEATLKPTSKKVAP